MGILGWFKNFIGKILLGFFAARLLDFLPTLSKLLPVFGAAVNFVSSIGVGIVDAFGTFVNIAYSAADATKGFIKSVGGEKTLEIFENFSGVISTLIDVLILSALVSRGRDDDGFGGRGRRGRRRGPDIDGPGRRKKKRRRRGGGGLLGLEVGRRFARSRARSRRMKAIQTRRALRSKVFESRRLQGESVAEVLIDKKINKKEEKQSVIEQLQQGNKRLIIRKKTLAAPKLTTKEVLSTPVGAAAGAKTVTRPFERKGFRAPRIDSPRAREIFKEVTEAERDRIKLQKMMKVDDAIKIQG